jgi:hypothetical protein
MDSIAGWLEPDEADLLLAACARSLYSLPDTRAVVEIGSYCGRSTVVLASAVRALRPDARVYAIDPHDGVVGAVDQGITTGEPTLDAFRRNIVNAGLNDFVVLLRQFSTDVHWKQPINCLFIDGLHDYASVSSDFCHFAAYIEFGGVAVFHDYADYYPGVVQFVDEVVASSQFRRVTQTRSLVVLERVS